MTRDECLSHPYRSSNCFLSILHSDLVHGIVEADHLRCIFEHVQLLDTTYEVAQLDSHKPDEHPSLIEPIEKLQAGISQDMIESSVGNMLLQGMGIEVGIPDLDGHTGGQLLFLPQLESQPFNLAADDLPDPGDVDGIRLKSAFRTDRLPFRIGFYRCIVNEKRAI